MHGVNGEVCCGVGGGKGSCRKRYEEGVVAGVGKCVGVLGQVRKDVWVVQRRSVGECMG